MTAKWIAFDMVDHDFEFFDAEEEAKKCAEGWIDIYRAEASSEGWPESMEVGYAKIKMAAKGKVTAKRSDYTAEEWEEEGYSSDFDEYRVYHLEEQSP